MWPLSKFSFIGVKYSMLLICLVYIREYKSKEVIIYSKGWCTLPVRTGRKDAPYVRAVRNKALHAMLFCPYGPYVRVVCTGLPFMSPVMLYPFN